MALTATILRLSEDIDLLTGEMAHFVVLALPNGHHVRALINEQAAQEIINLSMQAPSRVGAPELSPADVMGSEGLPSHVREDFEVPGVAAPNGTTHVLVEDDTAGQI
jgi:hypothetical protein